jgi:predicted Rossmann-fold nucleotide-binding protein
LMPAHRSELSRCKTSHYDSFLEFLRHAVAEGFLKKDYCELLMVSRDVDDLLNFMRYSNHTGEVPCSTAL